MRHFLLLFLSIFVMGAAPQAEAKEKVVPVHGIAMHGAPKYKKGFRNFDYVNPKAPKGGVLRMAAFGSFDTFNPYVIKGTPAAGAGMLYDTLMVEAADEPFSEYGLLAETIEMPSDRSWVAFTLNPAAKFHDGTPVTAEDVVFSFNILKEKGLPMFRYYYGNVARVTAEEKGRVLFTFKEGDNHELPLILGQMPVFPKHYWEGKDFAATTLTPPVGSGPYKIADFETGRYVVLERDPGYWAKDLPVMRGTANFDRIRYDYYRDTTVAVEAFKTGAFDLRVENEAKKWASAYGTLPAFEKGLLKKAEFGHGLPSGMQGFVFNTRRPLFRDRRVRQALGLAFDFEWSNKNLFYGLYRRTQSYFDNSELAAKGLPKNEELKLLEQFRAELPEDVFKRPFALPATDGSGNIRANLSRAFTLLEEAGWTVQDGVLKDREGHPFVFEILLDSTSAGAWERVALPYARNLKRLGIEAKVRTVDPTQYKNRTDSFDYDMIVHIWGQSTSPGNEQRYFWGSGAADMPGSQNYAGIKNPAVDALIEKIIEAKDRNALVAAVRALDRVLLWEYYVVPHWFSPVNRLVYWNKFGMPDVRLMKGVQLMSWWVDPVREKTLRKEKQREREAEKAERRTLFERLKEWF
ncbi:MAG: extracellular solute-binding protein [Alphaproteobacteria bacterium]